MAQCTLFRSVVMGLALGLAAPAADAADLRLAEAALADEIARVAPLDGELDLNAAIGGGFSSLWIVAPYDDLAHLGAGQEIVAAARATGIESRDDIVALILADGTAVEGVIAFPRRKGDFTAAARSRPYAPGEATFRVCRSRYLDGHSPTVKPIRERCL